MKVVGLLACAFMVIPSADAVDALKTCACLLKECRYDLILIGSKSLCMYLIPYSQVDYSMTATDTRILKCVTHAPCQI